MKAIAQNDYGSTDLLSLKEVVPPRVKEHDFLVKVYATAVNAGDYFSMSGSTWLVRFTVGFPKPKNYILGWDVADEVEEVRKQWPLLNPETGYLVPAKGPSQNSRQAKSNALPWTEIK